MCYIVAALCFIRFIIHDMYKSSNKHNLSNWSERDVANWIRNIGPEYVKHAASFEENRIDGPSLKTMTNILLYSMGISNILHQHRILTGIQEELNK